MNQEGTPEIAFLVKNAKGQDIKCDVISVVNRLNGSNPYVIYTDYLLNDKDDFNLYVSELVEENGSFVLKQVENFDVIPELQTALKEAYEQLSNKEI